MRLIYFLKLRQNVSGKYICLQAPAWKEKERIFWHSPAADAHVLLGKGTKSKWHLSSPLHFRADIHPSFANSTFDQNNISKSFATYQGSFPFQIISEATIFVNSAMDQLCPSDTDNIIICRQFWCQVNLMYMQYAMPGFWKRLLLPWGLDWTFVRQANSN